jgi:argininosuccinate synthase
MNADRIRKIVLAYSGGLDTSVMLRWLKEQYNCEVVCYCADVGQGAELAGLEEKALATGASKLYIEDLREEFVRDYVWTRSHTEQQAKATTRYASSSRTTRFSLTSKSLLRGASGTSRGAWT